MDDSFRARVQKAFGSLSASQSPWSLADGEVEKREWNRSRNQDDDVKPTCASSFNGGLEDELEDIDEENDDDDDDDDEDGGKYGDGDDKDEWEIRSSIGRDCTLDNEEEEDEYDKLAEGRENAGDRLYMSDVTNHGPYLNSYNVFPSSVHDSPRDARANHIAVRIRMKEDEVQAEKIGPNHTSYTSMSCVEEPRTNASEYGGKLKSILKRKVDEATSKEQKRVRFDPGCKYDCQEASENAKNLLRGSPSAETTASDDNTSLPRNTFGVPDYILNPSKYTCYSFDSASEVDDKSNSQVYMDFLKMIKRSKPEEFTSLSGDESSDLLKSITFVPRKKTTVATPIDSGSELKQKQETGSKQLLIQTGFPLSIAAGETQISEVNATEDEMETNTEDMSTGFQKSRRQYRRRSEFDESVS
ncbi:hypothetical protein CEY00_Acc32694 [Actinidia chinensis var. chinensis]|uniref:Uncharacterized protein n=1 Tax=Actinidia chinensis var. chinensis TaxID=1590841 RepID=A0A2R6P3D5_ACTCC|nr:hypothetical protein CEY00_Acc32694 [Actinidia chinensis var. chinensis]